MMVCAFIRLISRSISLAIGEHQGESFFAQSDRSKCNALSEHSMKASET